MDIILRESEIPEDCLEFFEPIEVDAPSSVFTLSSEPTSLPHFAAFPSELARRCVQAGTSDGGCCPKCLSPWAPVVESRREATRPALNPKDWKHDSAEGNGQRSEASPNRDPERHIAIKKILGYRPTCDCGCEASVPCTVLDPFAGIGTTIQSALFMGRNAVGIELNPAYVEMAEKRIHEKPRWWLRLQKPKPKKKLVKCSKQATLF